MKKLIICLLLVTFNATSFCQETNPLPLTHEDYLRKSKNQKLIGWILLGAGATTLIAVSGGNTDFSTLGTLVIGGGLATLGSIPFFIASGKNKRKANLMLKNETFLRPGVNLKSNYIAVGLKIPINK